MAGHIIEKRISAKTDAALNRSGVSDVNIDGGTLVTLGSYDERDLFKVELATGGSDLWMAYNPSEKYTEVNGKLFPGLSADPRDYTNIKKRPLDVFHPRKQDIIAFTKDNLVSGAVVNKGDFLEPSANGLSVVTTQTDDTTSFKVLEVDVLRFPQAGIGDEMADLYVCECVFN